jgi:hypothetical protein
MSTELQNVTKEIIQKKRERSNKESIHNVKEELNKDMDVF